MTSRRVAMLIIAFTVTIFGGVASAPLFATPVIQDEPITAKPAEARMEMVILQLINKQREKHGLPPLILQAQLTQAARAQSRTMAQTAEVNHTDPSGRNVADRAQDAGYLYYTILGENLAMNGGYKKPCEAAADGWMKSQGHRDNILNTEYTETGIGVVIKGNLIYFTQVFGNPAPLSTPE